MGGGGGCVAWTGRSTTGHAGEQGGWEAEDQCQRGVTAGRVTAEWMWFSPSEFSGKWSDGRRNDAARFNHSAPGLRTLKTVAHKHFANSTQSDSLIPLAKESSSHLNPPLSATATNLESFQLVRIPWKIESIHITRWVNVGRGHLKTLPLIYRGCYFHPTHWSCLIHCWEDLCAVVQSNCAAAKWAWLNWSKGLMRTPWGLSSVA